MTDTPKDPNRRPSLTTENEDLFNAHNFDIKIELDFPLPGINVFALILNRSSLNYSVVYCL